MNWVRTTLALALLCRPTELLHVRWEESARASKSGYGLVDVTMDGWKPLCNQLEPPTLLVCRTSKLHIVLLNSVDRRSDVLWPYTFQVWMWNRSGKHVVVYHEWPQQLSRSGAIAYRLTRSSCMRPWAHGHGSVRLVGEQIPARLKPSSHGWTGGWPKWYREVSHARPTHRWRRKA